MGDDLGGSFSFGLIGFTHSDVNTLNHERGHNWQLMLLRLLKFGLGIAIPSLITVKTTKHRYAPWEHTASAMDGTKGIYPGATVWSILYLFGLFII